jgi:hypothetical protein
MTEYFRVGEGQQEWGRGSRSEKTLLTGGVMAARDDGAVDDGGDSRRQRRSRGGLERPVPQPLLLSLSLRNTWLLPGFWKYDGMVQSGVRRE